MQFMDTTSGIVVIDKPGGITSRAVVNHVQKVSGIRRCGHAGTLDPLATGVLVIAVGTATRLVSFVQQQPKTYQAEFRFGLTSDTNDITGRCTETENANVPERQELEKCFTEFLGEVAQVPPQFSAVKVQGERAYERARQGQLTDLQPRTVRIDAITLSAFQPPDWRVEIVCGSGTYVRSIGRDIGQRFGCGAVMTSLVRTSIGSYQVDQAVTMGDLTAQNWQNYLLSQCSAVAHLPQYQADETESANIRNGQKMAAVAVEPAAAVAVIDPRKDLVAIAEVTPDQILHPRLVFKSTR